MMPDYQNPSMPEGVSMTIWRPGLRRPDRQPSSPRQADVEMAIALLLMGAVIVLTSLVVPAVGR
jgi:hypothetical protein